MFPAFLRCSTSVSLSCEGPPECGLASHRRDLIWAQAEHQEFIPRPGVVGQSGRAGGRGLERHVFADEVVVVDQLSIEEELEVALGLGNTESATGQGGEGVTSAQRRRDD